MKPVNIARRLVRELSPLEFSEPVTHVYNPLDYAFAAHKQYLERFGSGSPEVVLLGMNPGPWGMAQTGVPFGEVAAVRDWMGINAKIKKPKSEHPKRLITGFDCTRSEVSGARVWGWAQDRFATPEAFFERFFVANYCPLTFMEESGKNRTPDKLPGSEREALTEICDRALRDLIKHFHPKWVIGVGAYAEKCAERVVSDLDLSIGRILHPSPASPIANRGWAPQAEQQLWDMGIKL